jgi:MFS family permease
MSKTMRSRASAISIDRLPRSVVVLGLVSFLNDIATEMVVPLVPILLATTLAAGPWVLGLMEGFADSVAAFLRLWAGRRSDASGGQRKPLAIAGYTISNFARPVLGFATNWMQVVVLRAIDRIGKGIRSAPRDALIVDLTLARLRGRAFGLHRAFDNAGAVLGALVGAAVIYETAASLSQIVIYSAIPGFLGVILLAFAVPEPATPRAGSAAPIKLMSWRQVSAPLKRYLWVLALFTFARIPETFVILRAHELGAGAVKALLLWAALNFVKSIAAYWGGRISDRYGKLRLLIPGWTLHAAAMLGFCIVDDFAALVMVSLFFGLAAGSTEGIERALLGDHADEQDRGTLYGWYYAFLGFTAVPAGVGFGFLWQWLGAPVAFAAAAAFALAAVVTLRFWVAPGFTASPAPAAAVSDISE